MAHLPIGARVKLAPGVHPSVTVLHEEGTVIRSDARGALILFTSGRKTLIDPALLVLLGEPTADG